MMKQMLALLLAVLAGTLFIPKAAHAERREFACDGYLVGFNMMVGDYVDRIGAVCQAFDFSTNTLGRRYEGPMFATSFGGRPRSAICPEGMAVSRFDGIIPDINGNFVLERPVVTCSSLFPPYGGVTLEIRTDGDGKSDSGHDVEALRFDCGSGLARAFVSDVAQYVGRTGIRCTGRPDPSLAERLRHNVLRRYIHRSVRH